MTEKNTPENLPVQSAELPKSVKAAVPVLTLGVILVWMIFTPEGLLGKADAVGYAVCHRIATHSFFFGDRQLPLCARCSGMHLGALIAMLYQLRLGKRGGMPPLKILITLGIFLLVFAVDGVNSYLTLGVGGGGLFPNMEPLYTPMNWLRSLTGLLTGFGIGAVLYPIFNQSVWKDWDPRPALSSWKDLLILLGFGALTELALISENVFFLFPLAVFSALTVVVILTLIYTIVWVMIVKRENVYSSPQQAWVILLLGLMTAVTQIGLMDYGRFVLTGTWQGFVL